MTDLSPGTCLVFHFSGHGSQKRATSSDEADGYDETICPSDYSRAGQIVDNELNALLVRPLPPGVVLHCIIDACHSGTAFGERRGGKRLWREELSLCTLQSDSKHFPSTLNPSYACRPVLHHRV